jgi:hypothetical protein
MRLQRQNKWRASPPVSGISSSPFLCCYEHGQVICSRWPVDLPTGCGTLFDRPESRRHGSLRLGVCYRLWRAEFGRLQPDRWLTEARVSASGGGLANEAGSVHRRGVAAYLAAHGLLGRGLPGIGHEVRGPFPVRLEFETDRPTDDITCVLSDGSSLFVSAKRACGDDRHLRSTARQWAAQATDLGERDLLALAVAEPKGIVKNLGPALLRHHAGSPACPVPEAEALRSLRRLLSDKPDSVRDRVLSAARVLTVDAAEPGCHEFDLAAALLEGTIVAHDDGSSAVQALSQSMHTQAGKAFASGLDDWIGVLRAAGIEVFVDARGPAGAAARARQAAVEEHLARLRSLAGRMDLSLLAEDLPPLKVKNVAHGLRAAVEGSRNQRDQHPLLALARRWPRMLLVGLPGAGKSTALRQLAASWAADPRAPVPALVSLRAVSRDCTHAGELTLSLLCEAAVQEAPSGQRADLAAALEALCREGGAVLLLDGLDECADKRAVIADGLSALLASLPADTGIILATRSSGLPAAQRLGLPGAQLCPPAHLDDVLEQLLQHVASIRVAEADRRSWVRTRVQWLQVTREKYRDLGSVPLLATLLALVAADSDDDRLPQDQASLLMTAVQNSVRRWEGQRQEMRYGREEPPTDAQLLDGYAVLGHLLVAGTEVTAADASAAVTRMLAEHWGIHRRPAEEAARQITWFWDQHVGVFVRTSTGTVIPRSRVFTEIASAMWIRRLPVQPLRAWVSGCLADADRHPALLLAAEIDPRIITALLTTDASATAPEASALVAASAVRGGTALTPAQLMLLANRLAAGASHGLSPLDRRTATNAEQQAAPAAAPPDLVEAASMPGSAPSSRHGASRNGPGWNCACELAQLRLPSELSDYRRRLLAPLPMTEEQRTVVQALCVLTDTAAAGRQLSAAEEDVVRRALDLPLPEKEGLVQKSRRSFIVLSGASLLEGHAEVALAAAQLLSSLDHNLARRIHDIAEMASYHTYPAVKQALAARGHYFEIAEQEEFLKTMKRSAAAWDKHLEIPLLKAAAWLSNDESEMPAASRWRFPDLCNLFAALNASRTGFRELLAAANDSDEMLQGWMKAAATAADLNVTAVAAQARLAIAEQSEPGENDVRHIMSLVFTSPPDESLDTDPGLLGPDEHDALVAGLGALSGWIAHTAYVMLLGARSTRLRRRLLKALPALPAKRRFLAAQLACSAATDPVMAADELLSQADPAARAGAVRLISLLRHPSEQARSLLADASVADDLTIRLAARRQPQSSDPPATIWSCQICANYNKLADPDCLYCDRGTRPDDQ